MTPGFLAILLAAAFVGFVFSSTVGVGGALFLIPILALKMRPVEAIAISTPVILFNNVMKTIVFRRYVHRRALWLVCAGALPAACIAAWFAASVDDRVILVGVSLLIVFSLIAEHMFARPLRLNDARLVVWAVFTGIVSGLCGAAGPQTSLGLQGYGLQKEAFIGTVAVFAVLLQIVKLPAYWQTGALPASAWPLAIALSSTAAVAVLVAPRLVALLSGRVFKLAMDAFLIVSAIWMIFDVWKRS